MPTNYPQSAFRVIQELETLLKSKAIGEDGKGPYDGFGGLLPLNKNWSLLVRSSPSTKGPAKYLGAILLPAGKTSRDMDTIARADRPKLPHIQMDLSEADTVESVAKQIATWSKKAMRKHKVAAVSGLFESIDNLIEGFVSSFQPLTEMVFRDTLTADEFATALLHLEDYLDSTLKEVKALRKTIEGARRGARRNVKSNAPPLERHWGGVPIKKVFQRFALLGERHGPMTKARNDYDDLLKQFRQTLKDFGVR